MLELVLVMVLLGILSALALPSLLSRANLAQQSEAKMYISTLNRALEAYRLENNDFTANIGDLEVGLSANTAHYNYTLQVDTPNNRSIILATPMDRATLRGYSGSVIIRQGAINRIVCQTRGVDQQGTAVAPSVATNGSLSCDNPMEPVE